MHFELFLYVTLSPPYLGREAHYDWMVPSARTVIVFVLMTGFWLSAFLPTIPTWFDEILMAPTFVP